MRLRLPSGGIRNGRVKTKGEMMTRNEHMEWCKKRALEYCDHNDPQQAFTSMVSDLRKHPETENHSAIEMGMMLLLGGHLNDSHEMRKFIEGFN